MIIDTVELFLEKYDLLKPKNNIITAFSGGYDSMCLLDVMKHLARKHGFNLIAVHLNHNWRGEESDREEDVCKNFCSDITFYSEKLPSEIPHTETAAREARYDFFKRCAEKFNSKAVLTAHNANDNAETVFYRLMKGTGITGLAGIQEHRDIYYRPLLSVYRDEIEKYCIENCLNPNNDSSNTNTKYARNKIRYEIFPQLYAISPNVEKTLNILAQTANSVNKLLKKELKPLEMQSVEEFCNRADYHQNLLVHQFCYTKNIDYDRKRIEEIVKFINDNKDSKSGKTLSLTRDKWLFVNNKKIKVVDNKKEYLPEIKITSEGKYQFGEYIFEIEKCDKLPERFPKDEDCIAYVMLNEINFTLRGRNDGDIIQPLGLNGTQKLKKYLNEKKIPKHEKDCLVFLCKDNEILWAAGLGVSEKIKVVTKPTHVIKLRRGE